MLLKFLFNLILPVGFLATACASRSTLTPAPPSPTSGSTSFSVSPSASSDFASSPQATPDPFTSAREELVQDGIIGLGITDEAVIEAMRTVPRHEFVPPDHIREAYGNYPLPIGYGQTISQPYIVALMTQALELEPDDRVLEIGTGSGYQAAVLAELVAEVYTIEIIGALADPAAESLAALGYENVQVRHADGYFGWQEAAPFDAIMITAAPDHVPQPLLAQLVMGGRMVIPVGPVGGVQTLWQITRTGEEKFISENLGPVRFVPLTREQQP